MNLPIYMDHHATTPVDPRVLAAMLPYFRERFGNAASVTHSFGWAAQEAVEKARAQIAAVINADPKEIVFTSGATEADNLALKGLAYAARDKGNHIIVSAIEHNAVLDTARHLEQEGFSVTYLSVGADGIVDPDDVRRAITDRTIVVSIMTANNEIGTIQPIRAIGQVTRERGVFLHSDAAQALGRIPIDVNADSVDLLSLSAHKIYGPKGIGALFVRRSRPRPKLVPLIDGGRHEGGLRSGTLPVPLIVGFGEAARIACSEMTEESPRQSQLRDRLMQSITTGLDNVRVNGSLQSRLPNNLNLCIDGIDAEAILTAITDVALSSGAACSSAEIKPSHVLKAIGCTDQQAASSIRFGLGRRNTTEEVDYVAQRIIETVNTQRRLAPVRPRTP
jgi:cysteine desulfurase